MANQNTQQKGLICIAASTGGPAVLMQILSKLPADLSVPVVVIQHIWPGFTKGLADTLNEKCALPVSKAADGETVLPGHIYIAPAEYHLFIKKIPGHHIFKLEESSEKAEVKPRADYLLESLTESTYDKITALVLTGMGSDATKGLMVLSRKKDVTIFTQNEESCAVYGMPGNVMKAFPEARIMTPDKMAEELTKLYA